MSDEQQPIKVVVELLSGADVKRLEGRDDEIRAEVEQLRREVSALRRSFYELMEVFNSLKSETKKNNSLCISEVN